LDGDLVGVFNGPDDGAVLGLFDGDFVDNLVGADVAISAGKKQWKSKIKRIFNHTEK